MIARSLCSDRAGRSFGRYVATERDDRSVATYLLGGYVATETWLELDRYVATEPWLELGRYVATEPLLELSRYVATERDDRSVAT
ncbi:hypothetical protein F2Q68_00013215 [Brassica cretica]|uniref:Uncharacterized protein n=1 Tax=Brassica cretica TaxID=69181 RepID=A0A8S9HU24_BRACR|nr:hypothetical protein F2Q68_00013215 [Brassica cretica]